MQKKHKNSRKSLILKDASSFWKFIIPTHHHHRRHGDPDDYLACSWKYKNVITEKTWFLKHFIYWTYKIVNLFSTIELNQWFFLVSDINKTIFPVSLISGIFPRPGLKWLSSVSLRFSSSVSLHITLPTLACFHLDPALALSWSCIVHYSPFKISFF